MQDTAFQTETWLIYRPDGQYLQATSLLYRVLEHADGRRTLEEIARAAGRQTGQDLTAEDVRWLLEERVAPMGLLETGPRWDVEPRPAPQAEKFEPLLGLRWRAPLIPYRAAAPLTAVLQYLFLPPVVVTVLALAAAGHVWLYGFYPVGQTVDVVVTEPYTLLLLTLFTLLLRFFHEFGHASACRRGGVRHGPIGVGLYLVFPVFYADVSHVYRLNRPQRLRVDLGGVYFELIGTCVLFALYALTGSELLLLMVVGTNLNMVMEFNPFVRFDGYYVFADAIGVPDPLSYAAVYVAGFIPRMRRRVPRLQLKPAARALFGVYLATVVLFFAYPVATGAIFAPELVTGVPEQLHRLGVALADSWRSGDPVLIINNTIQILLLAAFPVGIILFVCLALFRATRAAVALAFRLVRPRPDGGRSPAADRPA
ncbi:MAG TPA: hypothetical protein VIO14_13655 [Dehalococcoidia bacterium]